MTDRNFRTTACALKMWAYFMTRAVIDMGNKLTVYLLTLLSLKKIQQVGSDWVEIMTETLCVAPAPVAFSCILTNRLIIVSEFSKSFISCKKRRKDLKDEMRRC